MNIHFKRTILVLASLLALVNAAHAGVSVPEPDSMALFGIGAVVLIAVKLRHSRK